MENLRLIMLENRINKTEILFELYKGMKDFFRDNPSEVVNLSFSMKDSDKKNNHYISFESSTDEGKSHVFSNVFHFLHKCISMFEPAKSPFGLFAHSLVNNPQKIIFEINKDNFINILNHYSDDFEGKQKWLELVVQENNDFVITAYNNDWGKHPTMIFNEKSFKMWRKLKKSEKYIVSQHDYKKFIENAYIIKKHISELAESQYIQIKDSKLFIFENNKVKDCFELNDFNHIKGQFKYGNVNLEEFINYNLTMIELNYGINEKMLNEIFFID